MNASLRPGFVLITTFLLSAAAIVLVTQLYNRMALYNIFIPASYARLQAGSLARSALVCAVQQLADQDTLIGKSEKEEDAKDKEIKKEKTGKITAQERKQQLLKTILLTQNRWQLFKVTEEKSGVDGIFGFYIMCEDGKIPLAALIDWDKKELKEAKDGALNPKALIKELDELLQSRTLSLTDLLQNYLKEAAAKPADITECLLLSAKERNKMALFLTPLWEDEPKKQLEGMALTDIFTLWNKEAKIDPFLLSLSLRNIYGLATEVDLANQIKAVESVLKQFKGADIVWNKEWDTLLKPYYKKDYKDLSKQLVLLFSPKFEPRTFSVLCYGKVKQVVQKIIALVARDVTEKGEVWTVKKVYRI